LSHPYREKNMSEGVPFSQVFRDELRAIETRRRVQSTGQAASQAANDNQTETQKEQRTDNGPETAAGENRTDQDLVGLALSGGGVRSASFNLGLIQALDRHGVFAQIDYLSTVSGGGFIGGYVSSLSLDHGNRIPEQQGSTVESIETAGTAGRIEAAATGGSGTREGCNNGFEKNVTGLAPGDNKPQPKRVRELIYSGDYLRLPLNMLNRYLLSVAQRRLNFLDR
jgi:hypothetical protein